MEQHAICLASQRSVTILANDSIARETFRLRFRDPAMASEIIPGQFLMIRSEGGTDPLLGRPFALYEVILDEQGSPHAVDIVYLVVGRGTAALSRLKLGDRAVVWGPLGNGFGPAPPGDVVFVAGGIGQTPFLSLGRAWTGQAAYGSTFRDTARSGSASATLLFGARSADLLAGLDDFQAAGIHVEIATDDGSAGHHGFVTDLLRHRLETGRIPAKVVACGPPPMLAAVTRMALAQGIDCDISLENHMACGFGACFSCVAPIVQPDGSTDLRRVCVEGPIFPANTVAWSPS